MCKKTFIENYFNKDIENKSYWLEYKNDNMPSSFFKYTSAKQYIYELINDDLMFLPKIKDLNDPFEIQLFYDIEKIKNAFTFKNRKIIKKVVGNETFEAEYIPPINSKNIDELNNILYDINENIKNKTSVVCLSERNDINPLWAHYADNHKGICIEYDLKNCNNNFLKTLCLPIDYVEKRDNTRDLKSIIIDEDYENSLFILKTAITKSKDWEYEQEWRIIFLEPFPNYTDFYSDKHYIKFIKPKSIYLGLDIDDKIEKKIKDICEFRGINLYKMVKEEFDFYLKPKPILKFNDNENQKLI